MTRSSAGFLASAAFVALGAAGVFAYSSGSSQLSFARIPDASETNTSTRPVIPAVKHIPTPVSVKAIYMTQCAVGTPSFREDITKLIDETELNAIVIDIKDYSGGIAFPSDDPMLAPYVSDKCGADDMKEFVKELHDRGVYVIGRITVFQDPLYTSAHPELAVKKATATTTVWKDHKGLSFIDVSAEPFWRYIVALSKASYSLGFDELNFDYIRFPSDGNMKDIYYPWSRDRGKQVVLEGFFKYLYDELKPMGIVLSADLFGMTATNEDDLNIGQVLERALPYFDYVAPMVYPSHYSPGNFGFADPASQPYEVIKLTLDEGLERLGERADLAEPKIRPWLQAFNLGAVYTPELIGAQILATIDSIGDNSSGWLLWDPNNRYEYAFEYLQNKSKVDF